MTDWLSTLVTLLGGSASLGVIVYSIARALPWLAIARARFAEAAHTREQTRLARAQTQKAEAEAKVTSEAATKQQLERFYDELNRRLLVAEQRAADAEARAEEAERKASECEKRNGSIIKALREELEELRRSIGRRDWTDPPPLPIPEETSSARFELVRRSHGDTR